MFPLRRETRCCGVVICWFMACTRRPSQVILTAFDARQVVLMVRGPLTRRCISALLV